MGQFAGFISDPFFSAWGSIIGGAGGEKTPSAAYMYPVVVDLDTRTVKVEPRTKGLHGKLRDSYDRIAREAEPKLQLALDTGIRPIGLHRYYHDVGGLVAELHEEAFATPTTSDAGPPPFNYDPIGASPMIRVPPGGFAGFAQQTPVAQRILSTGGRGPSTRRRKKKTTAKRRKSVKRATTTKKPKFGTPAYQKKYAAKAKRNRRKKK